MVCTDHHFTSIFQRFSQDPTFIEPIDLSSTSGMTSKDNLHCEYFQSLSPTPLQYFQISKFNKFEKIWSKLSIVDLFKPRSYLHRTYWTSSTSGITFKNNLQPLRVLPKPILWEYFQSLSTTPYGYSKGQNLALWALCSLDLTFIEPIYFSSTSEITSKDYLEPLRILPHESTSIGLNRAS